MLVEHRGHRPQVDPTAWIAPNATISSNVVIGTGARIYPPGDAPTVHEELNRIGFLRHVFGVDPTGRPRLDVMTEAMTRDSRALEAHRNNGILADE